MTSRTADVTDALGRKQRTNIVSESGFYRLVLRSTKPEALPFQRWVTEEVLPSIRKTGAVSRRTTIARDHPQGSAPLREHPPVVGALLVDEMPVMGTLDVSRALVGRVVHRLSASQFRTEC